MLYIRTVWADPDGALEPSSDRPLCCLSSLSSSVKSGAESSMLHLLIAIIDLPENICNYCSIMGCKIKIAITGTCMARQAWLDNVSKCQIISE